MLRSAGYRPAQAWVRAGGLAAGRYDSIEMPCVRSRLLRISVGMSCVRSRLLRVSVGMSCVRSRLLCTSVGMSCVRSRLLRISVGMSCVRLTPAPRFCWDVLRSITPAVCRMSAKQDGLRDVTFLFPRGSGSPFVRSQMLCGYQTLLVHFWLVRFFAAIPTEDEGTRSDEERGRRRKYVFA